MVPGKGRSRERSVYLSRLVGNTAYAAPVYKTKRPSPEGQAVRFFPEKTLLLSIKAAHDDFPAHGENARYTHSFSFVQFSCPNAPRLPPPVHDLPSQDIRPNGCCSPHGVSAALVTSLRLQCRPQRVLPLFLQNCRPTVSDRYGAQPHVVTEHVIHLSVRCPPNHFILYTLFRLLSTAALAKSCQNPRKNRTGTHLPCVPALFSGRKLSAVTS